MKPATASSGRPQNQATGQPGSLPWPWHYPYRRRRGYRTIPWLGLDNGTKRPGKFRCTSRLVLRFTSCTHPFVFLQLFGASAFTKDVILGLEDYSKATWTQNFIASIAGAVASITVAAPLDTIKTRIQNANFEHKVSGFTVIKDLVKNEGPTALFKGLTPKV